MTRLRDLQLRIGELDPGPLNAITDVGGVRVGHTTLVTGEGALEVGKGPVRTGVTVVFPRAEPPWSAPVFAGIHRLNGNGELTGTHWVKESGILTSAVGLTNTHSVGVVRDALVKVDQRERGQDADFWALPVVGETWDGFLSDINGGHVTAEHVFAAVDAASSGRVAEGGVGGGTGMICHQFKGGIGTSSRVLAEANGGWHVGVLVQANHGRRSRLSLNGLPIGSVITDDVVPVPQMPQRFASLRSPGANIPEGSGSIIIVVATDAPLIPTQCERLAQRAGLGIARVGGVGENYSGDIVLAFSTGNDVPVHDPLPHPHQVQISMVPNHWISSLFDAVIEATEEAIWNAILAAETMTGRDGITAHGLEPDVLLDAVARLSPS
jgi:D-aminopeptidase